MTMSIAFCDGQSPNPVVRQLGGSVNLSYDKWNVAEAMKWLYGLRLALPLL
jgi:hypothetical protein